MKNKDKVLNIINSHNCWITVKWINSIIWSTVDKTTIYRNINKLIEDWLILEDFSKSWEKLYSIKEKHHHHFICDDCWIIRNVWCFFDKSIIELEKKYWFKVNNHSFVLNWKCSECIK